MRRVVIVAPGLSTTAALQAPMTAAHTDFTRAFRRSKDLKSPEELVRCDRKLLERLKVLDENELAVKTKHYLNKDEVKALMARRDKIVAHFQQLIAKKGENDVLY